MGVLRYQLHFFIVFNIFRSIIRINFRIGGNKKQRLSIFLIFNLPNNNVGGSVNQSIIEKKPYCAVMVGVWDPYVLSVV